MAREFGAGWREMFAEFEDVPMAAASIGQVHAGRMKDGRAVAVKIQYPGIADSIDSDLNNLSLLLTASRLLPKGLYLDKTIAVARTELEWECDYMREAECIRKFGELLEGDPDYTVPKVIDEASGKNVITMERMWGIPIGKRSREFTQDVRDWIGTQILRLCLRELKDFKYMQTDPNWTNFLYNPKTKKVFLHFSMLIGSSSYLTLEHQEAFLKTLSTTTSQFSKLQQISIASNVASSHSD